MGESKRRKTAVCNLRDVPLPGDNAAALIGSVLANLARMLDAAIFLKQPEDGLLAWPLDAFVGHAVNLEALRSCPFAFDVRPASAGGWEFLIPDKFMMGLYCVDAMKRDLAFPGPIDPNDFPAQLREFFRTNNRGGWVAILPDAWKRAVTNRDGITIN